MISSFRLFGIQLLQLCCSIIFHQPCQAALNHLIEGGNNDNNLIVNFTKHLHNKHRFNSFVYFCETREHHHRPSGVVERTLEQALVKDFSVPLIVLGKQRNVKLRRIIGLNSLVFVNIVSIDDPILNAVDQTLEGLHFMPMLFIYKSFNNLPPNMQQIYDFFNWCWSKNIVNVALTFQIITREWVETKAHVEIVARNRVYNYSPFPVATVFDLTDLIYTNSGDFIVDKIINTYGYQFKTPIASDPPFVFLLRDQGKSEPVITGTAGYFYQKFIEHINGTIQIIPQHNISLYPLHKRYLKQAANKHIDVGIHPYSKISPYANLTEGSYPIGQSRVCIIVPVVTGFGVFDHLKSSSVKVFMCLLFCLIVSLTIFQLLWSESRHLSAARIGKALWNTFGTFLLQPMSIIQLRRRRTLFLFSYIIETQLILMVASIFGALLTVKFSKIPLGRQIESVDDFLQSNLKIMVHEYERNVYFGFKHLPAVLLSRLVVTDEETLAEHRDALNTSYAYVVTGEMWSLLRIQQQRLPVPRFRIAENELCTSPFLLRFPVQWDSPFINSLSAFLMHVQESGLSLKWKEETTRHAIEMNLIKIMEEKLTYPMPLSFIHIKFALKICVCMWICSLICFFGELVWHWWTVKRKQRLERKQHKRRDGGRTSRLVPI